MRRLRLFLLTLIIPMTVLVTAAIWRPDFFLRGFLKASLAEQGYRLTELGSVSLGKSSALMSMLTFADDQIQIKVTELELVFSFSDLLSGRVQNIDIKSIHIDETNAPSFDESVSESAGIFDSVSFIEELPFHSLVIHNFAYVSESISTQFVLSATAAPFSVRIETLQSGDEHWEIRTDIEKTTDNTLTSDLVVHHQSRQALSSRVSVTDLGENVLLSVDADLSLQTLSKHPFLHALLADAELLSDKLNLQSTIRARDTLSELSVSSFEIEFDNAGSIFGLRQQSDAGSALAELHLPIVFSGKIDAGEDAVLISSNVVYTAGDWRSSDLVFAYQATIESLRLSCQGVIIEPLVCEAESLIQTTLPSWSYSREGESSVNGTDLTVEGPLSLDLTNSLIGLSSPQLLVSLPSVSTTFGGSSLDLTVTELDGEVGQDTNMSFRFESSSLRPDISGYSFTDPAVSGLFQLGQESLTAVVDFSLAEQFKLGAAIQHFFYRDTGTIEVQLAPLEFSSNAPLSGLMDQDYYDFDLEAGKVSGRADVSWSLDQSGTWRWGGPVAIDFEDLSGFVNDTLFIDFNSRLFAEITTPFGLLSGNSLSASIDSVDPGMPLRSLGWEYGFDTNQQTLNISDFEASLLGGALEIPSFTYLAQQGQQQLNIILSSLEMAEIVALADYPNVTIDGRVSGYLPLVWSDESVTIENGLVGALSPGGIIRYTPTAASPSNNPSIKLVNDALSNYQYRLLDTQVDYAENGDLEMAVQLQGNNPDMNNGQAINLNVNISDNVPTLLRSLQAGRSISDELERQLRLRENP